MIDIRKLKELVRLMVENELSELDLQDQQETVTIKRGGAGPIAGAPVVYHAPAAAPARSSAPASEPDSGGDEPKADAPKDTAGLVPIVSPMVGTVYLSPNPESPAYVQAGAAIGPDSTVCLIEAMKVFSEIKAETTGTIERVLVTSGQAVQYGQQLFLVRPS
jgi:acetyl-CoA carboxylase biotin carboxyl carrier protein